MPICITDPEKIQRFTIRRYVRNGSRVDSAPMVSRVNITPLKVDNLKYVMKNTSTPTISMTRCSLHDDCQGHLIGNERGVIALPSLCINEDIITMDERGKLNHQLLNGNISPEEYSKGVRSTLMGKRGMLRHACMGIRPLSTIRGVASCVWNEDPSQIFIPRRWMNHMKIPFRRGGTKLRSPYWSFRSVDEGDYAILIRCPSISDNSAMPVRVYSWENPSIGVHPAMCEHLNLDFDGDEVHVAVVSSIEAVEEVKSLMNKNPFFNKFRKEMLEKTLRRSSSKPEIFHDDFMLHSSLSLKSITMSEAEIFTPIHELSRCKIGSWAIMKNRYNIDDTMSTYVTRAISALDQFMESHLTVSKGFTFGRQLKIMGMMIDDSVKNLVPHWFKSRSRMTLPSLEHGDIKGSYGFPGTRLASKISGKIMQGALDSAKHSSSTSGEDLILSILSMSSNTYEILNHNNRLRLVKIGDKMVRMGKTVATTSRFQMQMMGTMIAMRSCLTMLSCACESMKIKHSNSELAHMASMIYYSGLIDPRSPVTDFKPSAFLSKTSADYISIAVAENLMVADSNIVHLHTDTDLHIRCSTIAMLLGNFKEIKSRSISHTL